MEAVGKCPKCEQDISEIKVSPVHLKGSKDKEWKGAVYLCPLCNTIISAGLDPLLQAADIVQQVRLAIIQNRK